MRVCLFSVGCVCFSFCFPCVCWSAAPPFLGDAALSFYYTNVVSLLVVLCVFVCFLLVAFVSLCVCCFRCVFSLAVRGFAPEPSF